MKTLIDFHVIRRNKWGYKWIEEPKEREDFRNKCKYQKLGCLCEKGYGTYGYDIKSKEGYCLIGCTPDVNCPRLKRWDTLHGLKRPYKMIERSNKE